MGVRVATATACAATAATADIVLLQQLQQQALHALWRETARAPAGAELLQQHATARVEWLLKALSRLYQGSVK